MSDRDDATFIHTLARPVEIRGRTYTTLTVRRPLVRDLIAAERQPGATASDAALLAICADVPFGDFGHLDAGDFRTMLERAGDLGFFGAGPAAGPATAPPGASSSPSTPGPGGVSESSSASRPPSSSAGVRP